MHQSNSRGVSGGYQIRWVGENKTRTAMQYLMGLAVTARGIGTRPGAALPPRRADR